MRMQHHGQPPSNVYMMAMMTSLSDAGQIWMRRPATCRFVHKAHLQTLRSFANFANSPGPVVCESADHPLAQICTQLVHIISTQINRSALPRMLKLSAVC